jgi:transcriptional regulator with GAF, ATPase, and Fis domain
VTHARLVIHQLERQLAELTGVAQRSAVQASELAFLAGITDGVSAGANMARVFPERLGAVLHAAGIAKGAVLLRDTAGTFTLRHTVGLSTSQGWVLRELFGRGALIEDVVSGGVTVTVPSPALPDGAAADLLLGAHVATAQLVPLVSQETGVGVLLLGATLTDVTSEAAVAFGRALATQVMRSLTLMVAAGH